MIPDNEYIRIARITGSHSLQGALKIFVVTAIPERFETGNTVYLNINGVYKSFTVSDFRPMKDKTCLLKLAGIDDRNSADLLKGKDVFIDGRSAESLRGELDEDAFFYYDIIGCNVFLKDELFGQVKDIMEAGSGEILVIEKVKGGSVLVPFVESMVDTDRLNERIIGINPPEGLLDI